MDALRRSWQRLLEHRALEPLERLRAFVGGLSTGDRAVFFVLAGLLALASLGALLTLEGRFLAAVPSYGGSIVEGEVGSPRFVSPLLALTDADRDLAALTYAGLMGLGGDGSLVPVLASGYSVSKDGKVYTFTLRKDAEFSDGTPVTADDVVFTVRKAQDPGLKSPEYADWAGVTVEAVDPANVRFTLGKPYAPFLKNTTLGILPAHLWREVPDEQFPFVSLMLEPVGAGPFAAEHVTYDKAGLVTSYALSANPHFILGRPYLDRMRFLFFARQEDLAAALASGAVENVYGVTGGSGARVLATPYARVFGVFFNPSENNVFARLEVRKALSIAIDRAYIVERVLGGYASAIGGPVPPGSGIMQAPVLFATDPVAAAATVLATGGWSYDGQARAWKWGSGKSALTLGSLTLRTSNVPELKRIASAVKADWEKLGIATDIELYEPGDLNQNVIRPRKYEALLFGMVVGRDPDLYAFWDSQERNDPGLNIALYASKSVDALLEAARTSASEEERRADLAKVEALIAADYPAAFIEAPDFIYTVPEGLRGVLLPQIATPADRFATVSGWYLHTESVWPFLAGASHS